LVSGPNGRRHRVTIGNARIISPRQAREKARKLAAQVRLGLPTERKQRSGPTIRRLVEGFVASHEWSKTAPGTQAQRRSLLDNYVLPKLGSRAPESITRLDVKAWAGEVAREAATSGNRAQELLRRIYNWGIDSGLITCVNPCSRLAKPVKESARSRVYTTAELKRIVAASAGTRIETLVRLVMLTLTRSEETRAIKLGWMSRELITLPESVTKNGEAHPVPLVGDTEVLLFGILPNTPSPVSVAEAKGAALGLPRAQMRLFPAPTKSGYAQDHKYGAAEVAEASGVPDFRLHDLRRTSAALLETELLVDSYVIGSALGHKRQPLHSTYRPAFPTEKVRAALWKLALHYRKVLGDGWWIPDPAVRAATVKAMREEESADEDATGTWGRHAAKRKRR